jgi:TetR/AcrR family transcriptional repressor of nem operon
VEALAALVRRTVAEKKRMCLFGMMAAEVGALPTEVGAEARRFFAQTLQWLRDALPAAEGEAEAILAGLEGGVLLARAMDDPAMLEKVVERLRAGRLSASHLATIGQPATTR